MDDQRQLSRREWGRLIAAAIAAGAAGCSRGPGPLREPGSAYDAVLSAGGSGAASVKLSLCGDVMTGRGIDQILPNPGDPELLEPYVKSAARYVAMAEGASGPVPEPASFHYIWGDALEELNREKPDATIVNLETAVTASSDAWTGKGVNYRMHPRNAPCLNAPGIDCCVLANNHILDWGYAGLRETLFVLENAGLKTAGAGRDLEEAAAPAIIETGAASRVIVFGFATESAGVFPSWAAGEDRPGVSMLPNPAQVAEQVDAVRQPGDIVVASIHWGANWGYSIPQTQRTIARALIDEAGVDAVHGHSSHHPKGIEIYKDRPVLYGCGDLLNDYEGIGGREVFRPGTALMYFPVFDPASRKLRRLEMAAMRIRRLQVVRAGEEDTEWLAQMMDRECGRLGARVIRGNGNRLYLKWPGMPSDAGEPA